MEVNVLPYRGINPTRRVDFTQMELFPMCRNLTHTQTLKILPPEGMDLKTFTRKVIDFIQRRFGPGIFAVRRFKNAVVIVRRSE